MTGELASLVARLRDVDPKDDRQFQQALLDAIEVGVVTEREIAAEFSVSRPAARDWVSGANAPHPAMRRPIFAWLCERAQLDLLFPVPQPE